MAGGDVYGFETDRKETKYIWSSVLENPMPNWKLLSSQS